VGLKIKKRGAQEKEEAIRSLNRDFEDVKKRIEVYFC